MFSSRTAIAVSALALALGSTPLGAKPAPAKAPPASPAHAAAPAPQGFGAWGVDLATRDLSVRPGDDFQRYASGKWLDSTAIPADRASTGTFYDLRETVQAQVRDIITTAPPAGPIGALYTSYMDAAHREAIGLAPLMADIASLRALANRADLARFMGTSRSRFGISLVEAGLMPDTANAEMNVLGLGQSGLGLPDRDYYLKDQFKPQREAYRAYIARTLAAIGEADAPAKADAVLAFETEIARLSWDNARRRNLDLLNNPYSTAELAAYAPGIDWDAYFAGAGIAPQKRIIVAENSAIQAISALYAATALDTLKLWEAFHVADQAAPYLTKAMDDSRFAFTKTLSGVAVQRPQWKRGVDLVSGQLGELVGQTYVARHFSPAAKAKMEGLVAHLKEAMAGRIRANGWMSEATKQAALLKLSRMDVMVGYPDKWRDYAGLAMAPGDLYGNVERASRFNSDYDLADLGKPVDHRKWAMSPQTVNAYNGEQENKIVFPAAILQPPFFDPHADDAVNYGAIGAVIGHEISHAFDDQGRKIDASGTLRDWWAPEDAKRFEAEAKVFGDQYARFEAAPGAFVNPGLTMGENIADFAGVEVALDAYHAALGAKAPPARDGLTGDQRFFLAFAQVWRAKSREDALRNQVATDPHSPARFRVLGPLRNVDAWYQAFHVQPGDKMYLPPEKRARIW
ncbi:MAG TPA: M13 family metallopeptidase [Novosphingobium sp.]|nr:M13 family metallopeptidase [Novosphingobium sp.]